MKEIKNIKKYFIYSRSRFNYSWLKIKFMIYLSEKNFRINVSDNENL